MNFEHLRKQMVEEQIAYRGIRNQRVLDAFLRVQRHRFVPQNQQDNAYADHPLPIGEGQTISQPYIVALMTESLDLTGEEKVLEIGTGSGYQTAILAELAQEVFTIERFPELSQKAKIVLDELGYTNIRYKTADGTLGWKEEAPFDRIIVTAYCPFIPAPLTDQLAEAGKLVLPLGEAFNQMLTVAQKKHGKLDLQDICSCVFVPLIGECGVQTR